MTGKSSDHVIDMRDDRETKTGQKRGTGTKNEKGIERGDGRGGLILVGTEIAGTKSAVKSTTGQCMQ